MGEEDVVQRTHCQECGQIRPIKRTVPWQQDLCPVCGSDIEA